MGMIIWNHNLQHHTLHEQVDSRIQIYVLINRGGLGSQTGRGKNIKSGPFDYGTVASEACNRSRVRGPALGPGGGPGGETPGKIWGFMQF